MQTYCKIYIQKRLRNISNNLPKRHPKSSKMAGVEVGKINFLPLAPFPLWPPLFPLWPPPSFPLWPGRFLLKTGLSDPSILPSSNVSEQFLFQVWKKKNLYDFLIFTFFKPWETYEVVLQNSAVPKAAARASEMVWGSRSTGGGPDFWGFKNAPLVAQRF